MTRIPSPVGGITIEIDLNTGVWRLLAGDSAATLRPWKWGERRRLVEAATAGGTLDGVVFIDGLFDLLLEGALKEIDRISLAFTCLYLLGVPEKTNVIPLARAEFLAARAFGWAPQQLASQPAADIDRLVEQIEPREESEEGWTRIVIVPEGAASIEARLASMLSVVSLWAGLSHLSPPPLSAPTQKAPEHLDFLSKPDPPAIPFEPTVRGTARLQPLAESTPAKGLSPFPAMPVSLQPKRVDLLEPEPTPLNVRYPLPEPRIRRLSSQIGAVSEPRARVERANVIEDTGSKRWIAQPETESSPPRRSAEFQKPVYATKSRPLESPESAKHAQRPQDFTPTAASQPAPRDDPDFFPTFRVKVRWPETAASTSDAIDSGPAPIPDDPFAMSGLEEEMADVLDRAAREAGIDIP